MLIEPTIVTKMRKRLLKRNKELGILVTKVEQKELETVFPHFKVPGFSGFIPYFMIQQFVSLYDEGNSKQTKQERYGYTEV